jgi:Predicted membrane protein (DUF2207)
MSEVRPALVDLVLTKCTPGVAAYEATILDLAARGFLGISGGPDGLRVTLTGPPEDAAGLADYERQVLGDVRTPLAGADGAPYEALAGACHLDVDAIWSPFREKLLAEGRRLGICRKNLWATTAGLAFLFLLSILSGVLVALASRLIWHVSVGAAVVIGVVSWFVLGKLLETLGADVLTAAGAALAAQWQRERTALAGAGPGRLDPASLERQAFAVAAGALATAGTPGGASPRQAARAAAAARVAAGPPPETRERPAEIWSSFSGTWRRVIPESSQGLGSGGAEPGMMFSFAGITLGLTVLAVLMTANTIFLVPVTLAVVAVAVIFIVLGMGTVRRRSAMPKTATFDGQVVARWQESDHDSEGGSGIVRRTAIDDGVRAWIFAQPHVYAMVAVGDLVQVRFSPRTGELQRLTVTAARPRAERSSSG